MKQCIGGLLAALLTCLVLLTGCNEDKTTEYSLQVGSTVLTPGDEAAEPLAALGTYKNYSESGSCGGIEGLDKVYEYDGFTVKTTPGLRGGSVIDVIMSITLTDDSIKTPEGLTIGSTREAVTAALGAGGEGNGTLVYAGTDTRLTFTLRDGKVTGIQYSQRTE